MGEEEEGGGCFSENILCTYLQNRRWREPASSTKRSRLEDVEIRNRDTVYHTVLRPGVVYKTTRTR